MLIPLFKYLESLDVPGAQMFNYIMFRSAMAVITALLFSTIIGKKVIYTLQRQQIGEEGQVARHQVAGETLYSPNAEFGGDFAQGLLEEAPEVVSCNDRHCVFDSDLPGRFAMAQGRAFDLVCHEVDA